MFKYSKVNTLEYYLVPFLSAFNTDAVAACQHPLAKPQEGYAQQFCQMHGISQKTVNLQFTITLKGSIYLLLN